MHQTCYVKLNKMHTLKAQLKSKQRKSGLTKRRMEMLKAYANRFKPIQTDIIYR